MTLRDTLNGPVWVIWIVFAVFAVTTAVLLTGHGAGLISGYNTASAEKKARYDLEKLCRVNGIGTLIITILVLISAIGLDFLPAWFAYVCLGISFADGIAVTVLSKTFCRR